MANSDLVQSVAKALDLLTFAAESPDGLRLKEAAEHFGMKAPAVHNLLRTLVSRGYLTRDAEDAVYRLGPSALQLGQSGQRARVLEAGHKLLLQLSREFPESTLTITEFTGNGLICRLRISPEAPGQIKTPYKMEFPVYHSVTGRAAMIFSEVAPDVLERRWPFTEYAFPAWESRKEFEKYAAACRRKGYVEAQCGNEYLASFLLCSEFFIGIKHLYTSDEENTCLVQRAKELAGELL